MGIHDLQHQHALAPVQDDPPHTDHLLGGHGVADDREGLLPDLIGRRNVIGALEIAVVDLGTRHEAVDLDGMGALDPNLLDLLVLDLIASIPFARGGGRRACS